MPAKKTAAKKTAAAKKAATPKVSAIEKSRNDFLERFTKTHGDVVDYTDDETTHYEFISTGSLSLDWAMGGGYVEGRITEVWGGDAIGKTTLVLQGMREAQRKHPDKLVAFIDMEGTFDRAWAVLHGVNVSKSALFLVTPESAEDVADQVKDCIRSGLFSMVVLDSIGAMIPEAEKEKDADEAVVAIQAKIVTRMVKIAAVEARKTQTAVILINQVRANISAYGKATQTTGGFALKHCSTHKIEVKMGGEKMRVRMDGEDRVVGHPIAAMLERNKITSPFQRASFNLFHTASDKYGPPGIDRAADAYAIGIKTKVIEAKGAWYTLPNGERFNGKEAVVEALRVNPDWIDELREEALKSVSLKPVDGMDEEIDSVDPETGEILGGEAREGLKSRFGSLSESMAGSE